MRVVYTDAARKTIVSLAPELKTHIRQACEAIVKNPYQGKSLKRELAPLWSWAYKRYRVIYRIDHQNSCVTIIAIGHRRDIYGAHLVTA